MGREWRDETNRCLSGNNWLPLAVGTLVLADFGCGELLDIYITKLVPLLFLLSLAFPCL